MLEPALFLITPALSALLTGLFRHYALNKGILDIPNHRSSHVKPTPRGGGIAIVITFLLSLIILLLTDQLSTNIFPALVIGGGMVAVIGAFDDYRSLKARWRILFHFGAAAWGLFWLGGLPEIPIGGYLFEPGWPANLIGIVFLVWFLNLFNFMDGIDGIAASEALFISSAAALISWLNGGADTAILILFALSSLGFLFWNWPPARIFMGDAGSGFLGIMLALLAIQNTHQTGINIWTWLILAGLFILDATVTLFRRFIAGKVWYQAHRSHCYQILSRRWQSHRKVTVLLQLVNLFWLLPLAFLSACNPSWAIVITAVAWLPPVFIILRTEVGTE